MSCYPNTRRELDKSQRSGKSTKMGTSKYVYPTAILREMRAWFFEALAEEPPGVRILY